jgi:hypothetical protein
MTDSRYLMRPTSAMGNQPNRDVIARRRRQEIQAKAGRIKGVRSCPGRVEDKEDAAAFGRGSAVRAIGNAFQLVRGALLSLFDQGRE